METIIVHPKNAKEQATIEAVLKALDVAFHKQDEGHFAVLADKNKSRDIAGKEKQADEVWKLE